MNHSEISKSFARGETKAKGSRMFIDGDVIYSYGKHFPIAKRNKDDNLPSVDYLFNSDGYSRSTAKHKSLVLGELTGIYPLKTILYIKDCDLNNVGTQYTDNKNEIVYLRGKLSKARAEHIKENYQYRINFLEEQNDILSKLAVKEKLIKSIEV